MNSSVGNLPDFGGRLIAQFVNSRLILNRLFTYFAIFLVIIPSNAFWHEVNSNPVGILVVSKFITFLPKLQIPCKYDCMCTQSCDKHFKSMNKNCIQAHVYYFYTEMKD